MTLSRIDEVTRSALAFLLWLAAVMLNMAATLWLGFQGLKWLHDGYWTHQPTLMFWVHGVFPAVPALLSHPHSWYGVAKVARILLDTPSGLVLALLGILCAALSVSIMGGRPDAPRVTKSRTTSRTAASF